MILSHCALFGFQTPNFMMMRTTIARLARAPAANGLFSTSFPSALTGGLAANLKNPSLLRTSAFVGGEWLETTSGGLFDVTDPATGAVLASVSACGEAEVEASVRAADEAQKEWAKTTGKERSIVLRR